MGFLSDSNKQNSIYVEITDMKKKVRPLARVPTSEWVHGIGEVKTAVPGGQDTKLRGYSTHVCTSTGRGGVGCTLCSMRDPLWAKLPPKSQVNKKGQRADFPKKPRHRIIVWDYADQRVKFLRGGNQLFESMDKWFEMQKDSPALQDLSRCDWAVWKSGTGFTTQYSCDRFDASPFDITADIRAQMAQVELQVIEDDKPLSPQALSELINGNQPAAPAVEAPAIGGGFLAAANQQAAALDALSAASAASVPFVPNVPVQAQPTPAPVPAPVSVPAPTPAAVPMPQQMAPVAVLAPPAPVASASGVITAGDPAAPAPKARLEKFMEFISTNRELTGTGVIEFLVPAMRKVMGHTEYTKASVAEINALQAELEAQLVTRRAK